MPVTGTIPVIAIIFTTTPAKNQEKTPVMIKRSSAAFVCSATLRRRSKMAPKTISTRNSPTNPNVSPIIANTESLIDSGR